MDINEVVYEVTDADLEKIAKFALKVGHGQYNPLALIKIMQERLSAIEQDILVRYAVEGQTYKTIAQAFGCSQSTISGKLAKGVRRIVNAARGDKTLLFSVVEAERDRYKKLYEDLLNECKEKHNKLNDTPIESLNLLDRSYNSLKKAGKHTVGQLAKMTMDEFMQIRNIGRRSVDEIISKLAELGVSIASDDE